MGVSLSAIGKDAIQAALDEFERIGREAFLDKYGFGEARDYRVQHPASGTWADSNSGGSVCSHLRAAGYAPPVMFKAAPTPLRRTAGSTATVRISASPADSVTLSGCSKIM